jgi:ferredoxin-NADP reductase
MGRSVSDHRPPLLVFLERRGCRRTGGNDDPRLGDFTNRIASATPGQRVFLDGPYGAFTADSASADMLVLIAGGIGVTPMMSIIRTFADKGDKRPLRLLYGSRTYDEITFREELELLAGRAQLKVVHVLRNPHEGWSGESGYVDVEIFVAICRLPTPRTNISFVGRT